MSNAHNFFLATGENGAFEEEVTLRERCQIKTIFCVRSHTVILTIYTGRYPRRIYKPL